MAEESQREAVTLAMRQINQAWLQGQVDDLAPLLHDEIVMVLPGWANRIQGKKDLMAGFRDFCQNAKVHEFHEHDLQVDVVRSAAVVTFGFEMIYERSGTRYHSTGRDLWVFQNYGPEWIAIWRTMLDVEEIAA